MPTGVSGVQVSGVMARSSALAEEEIPSRKLFPASTAFQQVRSIESAGTLSASAEVNNVESPYLAQGTDVAQEIALQGQQNLQASVAGVQGEVAAVSVQVSNVQTSATTAAVQSTAANLAIQTAISDAALFGFIETGTAITQVWEHVTGVSGFDPMDDAIDYIASIGSRLSLYCVFRMYPAVSFLVNFASAFEFGWSAFPPQLTGCKESARLPGESDVTMLNRLAPDYSWVANFQGSDYAGASITWTGVSSYYNVFYCPPPPTLAQIKALWNYTPTSGPPVRSGVDDSMRIWSMLPIQY